MFRTISKCVIAAAFCVLAFPAFASAIQDGYYDSNNDGYSHTHYYFSDDYSHEYADKEPCTWQHDYYVSKTYGQNGHYNVYECPYCYGTKRVFENCSWKIEDRLCLPWNGSYHQVKTYYDCTKCENSKSVVSYQKHAFKWIRYGSSFWYECKACGEMPKYNGSALMDSNDTDNITIRKGKKYTYRMWNYNKSRNKIKSIKYSKKKICKVKRKGNKLIIKAKKKGKCRVTVKMRSGAKYTLKVRVK